MKRKHRPLLKRLLTLLVAGGCVACRSIAPVYSRQSWALGSGGKCTDVASCYMQSMATSGVKELAEGRFPLVAFGLNTHAGRAHPYDPDAI